MCMGLQRQAMPSWCLSARMIDSRRGQAEASKPPALLAVLSRPPQYCIAEMTRLTSEQRMSPTIRGQQVSPRRQSCVSSRRRHCPPALGVFPLHGWPQCWRPDPKVRLSRALATLTCISNSPGHGQVCVTMQTTQGGRGCCWDERQMPITEYHLPTGFHSRQGFWRCSQGPCHHRKGPSLPTASRKKYRRLWGSHPMTKALSDGFPEIGSRPPC